MSTLPRLSIRSGLLAVALSFASAVPAFAAKPSAEQWLNDYYRNPAPERFTSAVYELSRTGYFEEAGHVPLAIGFLATVFAQNPDKVDSWLAVNRVLPVSHQRILVAALWYSGNPKGADYVRSYARDCAPELRANLESMLTTQPSLQNSSVMSTASLNLQWGVFLATGDSAPVRSILSALATNDTATLGRDVRWSLAQNAAQHERVLTICRDELSRQPKAVRDSLSAVILDVESKRSPSS